VRTAVPCHVNQHVMLVVMNCVFWFWRQHDGTGWLVCRVRSSKRLTRGSVSRFDTHDSPSCVFFLCSSFPCFVPTFSQPPVPPCPDRRRVGHHRQRQQQVGLRGGQGRGLRPPVCVCRGQQRERDICPEIIPITFRGVPKRRCACW